MGHQARKAGELAALLRAMAKRMAGGQSCDPRDMGVSPGKMARDLEAAADLLHPPEPQPEVQGPEADQGTNSMVLHCDGGSRGNPGPAGAGAVLSSPEGRVIGLLSRFLGEATNNVAEYQALIMGLEQALAKGAKRLEVRMDSELAVKQLNGQYSVKSPRLKPLFQNARRLLRQFEQVNIIHIRRGLNSEADRLANEAMDRGF